MITLNEASCCKGKATKTKESKKKFSGEGFY